ncbi:MAG TPA: hypothetical protein VNU49_03015 [Opitutaceae bacterium]|nr:hypothetical protein [Opitutaceae bacterium]
MSHPRSAADGRSQNCVRGKEALSTGTILSPHGRFIAKTPMATELA